MPLPAALVIIVSPESKSGAVIDIADSGWELTRRAEPHQTSLLNV